jgi:hypothetical protein
MNEIEKEIERILGQGETEEVKVKMLITLIHKCEEDTLKDFVKYIVDDYPLGDTTAMDIFKRYKSYLSERNK